MLPSKIIERARRLTATSDKYYDDTMAYEDLNDVKNDLWSTIVTYVNEDFYWQEWFTNPVVGQGEYTLPPIASTTAGAKKLKNLKIAYDTKTYPGTTELMYVNAKEISPSTLQFPWSHYELYQDPLRPIYYVADNSYFIAPKPTIAVPNGIVITGIRSIPDYTPSTTEAEMIIPLDQQKLLIYGLIPYIFNQKVMASEEMAATQKYEILKQQMIGYLTERVISPFENQFPDDMAQQVQGNNNFFITI